MVKLIVSTLYRGSWKQHSYSCHVETEQNPGSHPRFKKHTPAARGHDAITTDRDRPDLNTARSCAASTDNKSELRHWEFSHITSRPPQRGHPSSSSPDSEAHDHDTFLLVLVSCSLTGRCWIRALLCSCMCCFDRDGRFIQLNLL